MSYYRFTTRLVVLAHKDYIRGSHAIFELWSRADEVHILTLVREREMWMFYIPELGINILKSEAERVPHCEQVAIEARICAYVWHRSV